MSILYPLFHTQNGIDVITVTNKIDCYELKPTILCFRNTKLTMRVHSIQNSISVFVVDFLRECVKTMV